MLFLYITIIGFAIGLYVGVQEAKTYGNFDVDAFLYVVLGTIVGVGAGILITLFGSMIFYSSDSSYGEPTVESYNLMADQDKYIIDIGFDSLQDDKIKVFYKDENGVFNAKEFKSDEIDFVIDDTVEKPRIEILKRVAKDGTVGKYLFWEMFDEVDYRIVAATKHIPQIILKEKYGFGLTE